jgi:hypothetical protein
MSMYDIAMANALRNRRRKVIFRGQTAGGQSTSLDFTGAALPAGLSYSGNTGNRTLMTYPGTMRATSAGARIRQDVGTPIEPAATNLMPQARLEGGAAASNSYGTVETGFTSTVTLNSQIVTINKVAHGKTVGQFFYSNSMPINNSVTFRAASTQGVANATAVSRGGGNMIVAVPTADTFEIIHHTPATGSGTSASGNAFFAPAITTNWVTAPTGWNIRTGTATRYITLWETAEARMGSAPSNIGAKRVLRIGGTGTDYLQFTPNTGANSIAATPGQVISFQLPTFGDFPGGFADTSQFLNATLELALVERDAGGAVLRETVVDLVPFIGSSVYGMARVRATMGASTATVQPAIKISGASPCDCLFSIFEPMVSLGATWPSHVLPPIGAPATATGAADVIDPWTAPHDINSLAFEFDAPEIIAATDGHLSVGGIEIRSNGSSFPRDLLISDGTNTLTLAGVIRSDYKTQGFNRLAVSWGAFGIRAAFCSDFVTVTTAESATFNPAAATRVVRFGTRADNSARGHTLLKHLEISDQARTLAELATLASPLRNFTPQLPVRDIAIGRTSVNPLKVPGIDALPTNWNLNATTRRISANPSGAALLEDWDFRGWYVDPSNAVPNLIIRQCLFDDSGLALAGSTIVHLISMNVSQSNWTVENNTFSYTNAGTITQNIVTMINSIPQTITVQRNIFGGVYADAVNMVGGTFKHNRYTAVAGRLNRHSDCFSWGRIGTNGLTVEANIVDMRNLKGSRCDQNSGVIGSEFFGLCEGPLVVKDNIIIGSTNQVQLTDQQAFPNGSAGTAKLWLPASAPSITGNRLEMATNNALDITIGNAIRINGPASFTISGTGNTMQKLGLAAGTYANVYTGGGLTEDVRVAATINAKLTGTVPSLSNGAAAGADSGSTLAVGQSVTMGAATVSFVASGAVGNTQANITDTLAVLFGKLTAQDATLSFSMVPILSAQTDNLTLLRGVAA